MIRSLIIWSTTLFLVFIWPLPMLVVRLFDRDPARYSTGLFFRKLGRALTRVNPAWKLHVSGETVPDPRRPFVVVCNHQSLADIPLISNLPWEMKWIAKKELFKLPFVGWMLRLAGDISVDRTSARSGATALVRAQRYLEMKCSVMVFPEGTRTPDGRVWQFADGAFQIAIKTKTPVLPLAIEGTRECIPKQSWKFGKPSDIFLKVLAPVETSSLTPADLPALKERVRFAIMEQISEWRSVSLSSVDGLTSCDVALEERPA